LSSLYYIAYLFKVCRLTTLPYFLWFYANKVKLKTAHEGVGRESQMSNTDIPQLKDKYAGKLGILSFIFSENRPTYCRWSI